MLWITRRLSSISNDISSAALATGLRWPVSGWLSRVGRRLGCALGEARCFYAFSLHLSSSLSVCRRVPLTATSRTAFRLTGCNVQSSCCWRRECLRDCIQPSTVKQRQFQTRDEVELRLVFLNKVSRWMESRPKNALYQSSGRTAPARNPPDLMTPDIPAHGLQIRASGEQLIRERAGMPVCTRGNATGLISGISLLPRQSMHAEILAFQ